MKTYAAYSIAYILLCGFTSVTTASAEDSKPMNILLLYADDWRFDTLGVAGNETVQTPFLDELASKSIRFDNNYVTTSICGVSRATLLTGQWMSRHGNRAFGPFDTPWSQTYPGLLREHGYYVGHVGKWHNGPFPAEKYDFGRSYFGKHWMENPDGTRIHVTQKNEVDALDFLNKRPVDKPFCLTVAFFATHAEDSNPLQFLPQPESMKLYQDDDVEVPVNATEESFRRLPSFIANEKNEGRNRWHWRFDSPEKYQSMMKNYYRLATEVDQTCSRLLAELDRQGLRDNTLVIFTTDNGYYHGEHGLADKWYPHQESIRVPLIIFDPRSPKNKAGAIVDAMTLNVDLAPTILAAANIQPPETMQGHDLSPLYLSEKSPEWRTDFFYEHPTIRSIDFIPSSEALVTDKYKYFYWPDFEKEQLFNLELDPHEEDDLVADAKYSAKLDQMRQRFKELKAQAK